jgi:type III restriction enzyme
MAGLIGAKPWKYLLIPYDVVTEDKRLTDFLSFGSVAPSHRTRH